MESANVLPLFTISDAGAEERFRHEAPNDPQREALVCLSHLRWDFVFQRPQHLLSRAARSFRVYFVEEPIFAAVERPSLDVTRTREGVVRVVPRLAPAMQCGDWQAAVRELLRRLWHAERLGAPMLWVYTPMGMAWVDGLPRAGIVYDCMDELSLFKDPPPGLLDAEQRLLDCADIVFTGGRSLYLAKKDRHAHVHALPSSVDAAHFGRAREPLADPPDQAGLPHPRAGYLGVIDERMDLDLLRDVVALQPHVQFVMIGPVAKIDPATLPRAPNLHWLGGKSYGELPAYLANWSVALMPFARNDSTRFISPTKTPEYLAAGLPVVSTPIADVVTPYGERGLVRIAEDAPEFAAAIDALLCGSSAEEWRAEADAFLATTSWDSTWAQMTALLPRPAEERRTQGATPAFARGAGHWFDWIVVGGGFAGSVMAERLAADAGQRVLLVDRRPHIGGNAYDHFDDAGLLIHRYGPHIFHTNSDEVVRYLSRFTAWRPYEHRVLADIRGQLVPIPINRTTINRLYGLDLDEGGVAEFLAGRAEHVAEICSSEDVVVNAVGRELYELFFRGYTRKQWGLDPSELDKSVTARVPTRTNDDDRYFQDKFQQMPLHGYTRMFERMLDHPNIKVLLNCDWREIESEVRGAQIVFTGPVDEYFDHRFGPLPYRSLRFRHITLDQAQLQPVAVVNHPDQAVPYTRVTEYKHLTGQAHRQTSVTFEFPSGEGDPFYPIPMEANAALYKRYQALADAEQGVHFVGRLATYRYYNMDQVVGQALALYARIAGRKRAATAQRNARSYASNAAVAPSS